MPSRAVETADEYRMMPGRANAPHEAGLLRDALHQRDGQLIGLNAEMRRRDKLQADLGYRIMEMQLRLDLAAQDFERQAKYASELQSQLDAVRTELSRVSAAWQEGESALADALRTKEAGLRLLAKAGEQRARATRPRGRLSALLAGDRTTIVGHLDRVENGIAAGWVWDKSQPTQALALRARIGERIIGTTTASEFRADLAELGYGDGHHGFHLPLAQGGAQTLDGVTGEIVIETVTARRSPLAIFDLTTDDEARRVLIGPRSPGTRAG